MCKFNLKNNYNRGFLTVEMLVAMALFLIIVSVGIKSLFVIVDANRKAQSLNNIMNNINLTVEGIARDIRLGTSYYCNPSPSVGNGVLDTFDCASSGSGGTAIAITDQDKVRTFYRLDNGYIKKSTGVFSGGELVLSGEDVFIDRFNVFVEGSTLNDNVQPRVILIVSGYTLLEDVELRSSFSLQTTVTGRIFDRTSGI